MDRPQKETPPINISQLVNNLTQTFFGNSKQYAYRIVKMPSTMSELIKSHCQSDARTHFFIDIGNGEIADLKTRFINYRQDPIYPDRLMVYGILTSVKNAEQLPDLDLDHFQRNTPIQIYCDRSFTEGVLKFVGPALPCVQSDTVQPSIA